MTSTIERTVEHFGGALAALGSINKRAKSAQQLLALLGWDLPPGVNDIGLAQLDVALLATRLDELTTLRSQSGVSDADLALAIAGVVDAVASSIDDIDALVDSFEATPDYLSKTHIADEFFDRIANLLVIHAIGSVVPAAVPAATLLGVFEFTHTLANPAIFQVEHVRQVVRWDRLGMLFTDPGKLLRDVYGWGTANFRGNSLVANIGRVVEFIAADVKLRALPRLAEEQLAGRAVPEADSDPAAQFFVSLDKGLGVEAFNVGISLFPLRASAAGATDGGIGLSPFVFGTSDTSFTLSDTLSLMLSASEQLQGGVALLLRAGRDPQIVTGLLDALQSGAPPAEFSLTVRAAAASGERYTLFSVPDMTIDAAALSAGMGVTVGSDLDSSLVARIEDGRIRLQSDSADGFLASLLPPDGIMTTLNLEVSWSHRDGLHFKGNAGLSTTLAINRQIGPLRVDAATLALNAATDGLKGSVAVSGSAQIGPVTASMSGIGAAIALRFVRGNLGAVDLGALFLPPSGIGLSVDAHGVLTGGGFLFHDPAQGLYAGVMQLSLQDELTLSAYGLIATKMTDGSRGYSLLIFITAEGFPPVPLGFGFQLQAIGGMLGVHRTFDQEVIKAGLKTDVLATLLFPRDPVANAPALIQALAAAFPAKQGSYLLGLLARITWFTPTLVQLDLALILELGARTRLLALGRVSALLPSRDNDLIRLNLDALGVLDFNAGTLAADAVLVDSRLAHQFPITGSAALRACWSGAAGASFVLAVGGLHPRFAPPTGFPPLERVAIALCTGNNPRLLYEAYFAITANTVQFGAQASLYVEAGGFSVAGDYGYDALVTLLPPHFLVDFHAAVQLKRGSHSLFKVTLDGTLEGPLPLRLAAKATFELLWMSFSVHFDFTLAGGDLAQAAVAAVALASELAKALADPGSWSTRRVPGLAHGVALRSLPAGAGPVLDPLGQLMVQQQVAPLNTARDVDTYGGAPVAGPHRFQVTATLNGGAGTAVTGAFAPARYFAMSDDEKLVAPSFEPMDAGLVLGDGAATFDAATDSIVPAPLTYEAIVLNAPAAAGAAAAPGRYALPVAALKAQSPSGAAARVPVRRVGRARFRNAAVTPAATLAAPRWRIVRASDGALAPEAPGVPTWSDCRAALAALNRGGARWLMVPQHELEALEA